MKTKISLDEFLKKSSSEGLLCTIETIKNDDTKVLLTPWIGVESRYGYRRSIAIAREIIENVSLTDQVHYDYGRKYQIVEVFFKQGASINVLEAFEWAALQTRDGRAWRVNETIYNSSLQTREQEDFSWISVCNRCNWQSPKMPSMALANDWGLMHERTNDDMFGWKHYTHVEMVPNTWPWPAVSRRDG